nr:hypothetical protein CFP56_64444 [Quercus suber]
MEVVAVLPSSAVTPPVTLSKGKGKVRKSIWEDLATSVGQAHSVIINEKLRDLFAIPSHELVSRHIHKLMQVESAEDESSRLRKDLVEAIDQAVKSKKKADELKKALKYFKGFKLLHRWMLKHQGEVIDLSTSDFETVDTKLIADEAKEEEK